MADLFETIKAKIKASISDIENHVGPSEGGVGGYYTNLTICEAQYLVNELRKRTDQIAVFEAKLKEVENWAIRLRDLCDKNHLDYVAGPDDLALLLAIVYADGKFLNYLTKG